MLEIIRRNHELRAKADYHKTMHKILTSAMETETDHAQKHNLYQRQYYHMKRYQKLHAQIAENLSSKVVK